MHPRRILAALADLAPAGGERVLDVSKGGQPILWLRDPARAPRNRTVDRLAALDELHRDERILRRGWAWVVGGAEVDGVRRKVRLPLLAEPVRLERGLRGYRVVPAGDLELTSLVTDREAAAALETAPGLGGPEWLRAAGAADWIHTAAAAAGVAPERVAAVDGAMPRISDEELVGYAVAALFVVRDVSSTGLRDTLLTWAGRDGLEETALARVYGESAGVDRPDPEETVLSPLPLSRPQREVVRRVRHEPVVAVSGPPGNGKSHAVVAAALDTVDRGGSVLVATQSRHAAEVLGDLLRRYPGAVPVLFGDAERREAIAAELAQGAAAGVDDRRTGADRAAVADAEARVAAMTSGIAAALTVEQRAAQVPAWEPLMAGLRVDAPRGFEPGFDVEAARDLLLRATPATDDGRWRRWRRKTALRRLRRATGSGEQVRLDRVSAALSAAEATVAAARLAATGGTDLGPSWDALADADAALAEAVGVAMRNRARSARRWSPDARRAVTALATALRAGRNRRRAALAGLDGAALVRALPLWVGTVTDVEDLLPPVPGMFDLVILDEAAHIDQIRAAPVLARARSALVVGDPRQLRFVSFVADVDVAVTLARHGLDGYGDRLDVRRASAYDVAVGATPVTYLEEHYRSIPHLIEFSASRFYRDRIALMTRHPRNDRADAIDVVPVDSGAVDGGVNRAEVDAVVAVVKDLAERKATGIGVITPFRDQADALESALLAAFPVEDIERLRLRTGTVHAFQGSEADTVVVSLGLVDGDSPARQRFASDPHLFNVMVTRARERLVVVTSLTRGGGIIGDYLAYGSVPLPAVEPAGADGNDWTARLAAELRAAGLAVRVGYPVGRWSVDLCVGEGDDAVGLICGVHPEGLPAHLERQRALRRMGWALRDAFASRWSNDPVRAALELTYDLRGATP
ncbi:ATP-binding domain-containing protein [Planosporangium flavigriseum]|uniref:DNA2/NAM7 helicase-like C-terminal domain-containing protein n=1 Tax=Planosporangium flavigriseum TaxID=373681 RepID=A0A8J3LYQ0_9ACTN|nr:ATP-binding protein [Planosporangium flavigriseum]NJC65681.1 ATP-binding domain-containing protein [Planosporangium flavigriseum]GIG73530.1 hypothetical protein Pfl04_19340 [Planosporangium flavigriseum]